MFQEILASIREFLNPNQPHPDSNPGIQILVVGVIVILSVGIRFVLRWLLRPGKKYISTARWSTGLLTVGKYVTLPITVGILLNIAIGVFTFSNNNTEILAAINRAVIVWVVYEIIRALIDISMEQSKARFWGQKVLFPIAVIVAILNALNLLDNILNLGFQFSSIDVTITIGTLLLGTAILVTFLAVAKWARNLLLNSSVMADSGMEPSLVITISKIVSYGIIVVGLLIALGSIGINMSTLTVILGGMSVGLAFGLQDIVNNFVSGFILLFERSVEPGDVVEVTNNTGTVKTVGVRSTVVTTRDNVELIIPNSLFLTEIVTNMTHSDELVRTKIGVGVTYNCNPREISRILLDVARQHQTVLPDPPPTVQFVEFGESSLNFELYVWTDKAIQSKVLASDLRFQIWDALAENNIEIPFPQRDIHIRSGVPWDQFGQQSPQLPAQEK